MTPEKAQELQRIIFQSRAMIEQAVRLLDSAEAAMAPFLPGGDVEKQREAERTDDRAERERGG